MLKYFRPKILFTPLVFRLNEFESFDFFLYKIIVGTIQNANALY